MEIIKNRLNRNDLQENKNISKDLCFFDIETTGFNRNSDIIYLIGILYFDREEDSWLIAQYFANELKDEVELLAEASKLIMSFKTIVNYNGNAFDIPFINSKLKSYSLPFFIDKEKSLDLYATIRKNKDLLEMDNLRLKTVEEYLGIYREDIYSGKDCIDFYKNYILYGDLTLKERLLKHNYEDLYFLIDIMDVLDIIRKKRSFEIERDGAKAEFFISHIRDHKDNLIFQGQTKNLKGSFTHYDTSFNVFIEENSNFEIVLYTQKALVNPDENCIFIDKKDFNLSKDLKTTHAYLIPQDLFLLKIGPKYLLEDALDLLREIIKTII